MNPERILQAQLVSLYAASLMTPPFEGIIVRRSGLSPMDRDDRDKKRKRAKAQRQARKRNR